ncbi:MAG: hypothetical protein K0S04_1476 [Herbinix sp.]|nr:hypothetical protein [Herbinix sp.]
MKFSQVYRIEIDNITVSEATKNKVYTYLKSEEDIRKKKVQTKFLRTAFTCTCLVILFITGVYNINTISAFARTVFSEFIFDMGGEQVEMGEMHPVKFNMDTFLVSTDVNVLKNDEKDSSYWKNYRCLEDLANETGITMISSELLKNSSDEDNYNIHIFPTYHNGHLNADFVYGRYHVNMDGRFALEGFSQDLLGYGTSEDEKYDSVYESSNGIRAYFAKSERSNKIVFKAGNILYQVNSNAPIKELEKLIDSFKY